MTLESILEISFNVSNTSKWVVRRLELRLRFLTAKGWFCLKLLGKTAKKNAEKNKQDENIGKQIRVKSSYAIFLQPFLGRSFDEMSQTLVRDHLI